MGVRAQPELRLELDELVPESRQLAQPDVDDAGALEPVAVVPGAQLAEAVEQVAKRGEAAWELLATFVARPERDDLVPRNLVAGDQEQLAVIRPAPTLCVDRRKVIGIGRILHLVREQLEPRHLPDSVYEVAELPRDLKYEHLFRVERRRVGGDGQARQPRTPS